MELFSESCMLLALVLIEEITKGRRCGNVSMSDLCSFSSVFSRSFLGWRHGDAWTLFLMIIFNFQCFH